MKKGMVMSIKRNRAYVFTEDCRLIWLPLQPHMAVGREIVIDMEKPQTARLQQLRRFKPALAAASIMLVLALGILLGQGLLLNRVYACVSVDINPGVQFDVNRQLEVVAVKAMNREAEALLAGQQFKGLGMEQAVYRWKALAETQFQVHSMLLAAVLPEDADALRDRLMQIEREQNQGEEKRMEICFIYSNDQEVTRLARKNGLSVGRQMLLNQDGVRSRHFDAVSIASAPLDELIPEMLGNQDRNQTRLTERTTQSFSETSGNGSGTPSRETSGMTSRATTGSLETNRETSRQRAGDSLGSSQPAGQATTSSLRETERATMRETRGGTAETGTAETIRETSRETIREAGGTAGSGTAETSRETSRETSCEPSGTASGTGGMATSGTGGKSGAGQN